MYFHISNNVRLTSYGDSLILLDLQKNQYIIFPEAVANNVRNILKTKFEQTSSGYVPIKKVRQNGITDFKSEDLIETLQYFLKEGYVCKKHCIGSDAVNLEPNLKTGASNIDWKINHRDLGFKCGTSEFLMSYWTLIKVSFISYFFSFEHLVNTIRPKHKSCEYVDPSKEQENSIAYELNVACFYFPFRIKCLEWAVAYVKLGHSKGFKCNLQIGVQNMPFMAHAWVQTVNGVVSDDPNLPKNLAVILSEPFDDIKL